MYEYDLLRYRYVDCLIKETICSKTKHAFRRRATFPRAGRAGGEREPLLLREPPTTTDTNNDGSLPCDALPGRRRFRYRLR